MSKDLFLRPLFDWRAAVASPYGPKNPTTRHVLLTLSLHMSPRGDSCFPSIELLTEESGLARRSVAGHLGIAATDGWIGKRERPEKSGQGWRRIEYFPQIPEGVEQAVKAWAEERSAPRAPRQGGATGAEGGASDDKKVVHHVHSSSSVELFNERPSAGRAKAPSPVAAAFHAYQQGIKDRYQAEYPPSAKANGQLAQVVGRVGAEAAVQVVTAYLGHQEPFYAKTKHSLDFLVRDCEKIWLELQASKTASQPKAPTHARVALLRADGTVIKELDESPAGNMESIAKAAASRYAHMIANFKPKYLGVRQGAERRRFSIEELRA